MGRKQSGKPKQKRNDKDTYKGKIEMTRSGMGFVVVEDLEIDILVRPGDFGTALHGDTVRVAVNPTQHVKEKGCRAR
jgi:ribonuclease R